MLAPDLQLKSTFPPWVKNYLRWRDLPQQWRNCYLLLAAIFLVVRRMSATVIPTLEGTRFMGGLHPGDVLLLMNMLKMMWLIPVVWAILYALSFAIKRLNTAEAIAGGALCSSAILAFVLLVALIR